MVVAGDVWPSSVHPDMLPGIELKTERSPPSPTPPSLGSGEGLKRLEYRVGSWDEGGA